MRNEKYEDCTANKHKNHQQLNVTKRHGRLQDCFIVVDTVVVAATVISLPKSAFYNLIS